MVLGYPSLNRVVCRVRLVEYLSTCCLLEELVKTLIRVHFFRPH